MSRADRLEAKADRIAAAANRAANNGDVQKELRLHDKWERVNAKAQAQAQKK